MNDVVQASLFAQALTMDKGALFSDCQRYRYLLWRTWEPGNGKSGQPAHPLYIPYSAKPFEVLDAT